MICLGNQDQYCQKVYGALHYLLGNIFIRFGSKLNRQTVGIPMVTNYAPLVADFFICYERDFMFSLSNNNTADFVEAFNSTSRYLDDLLNIDNPCFDQMVSQIYPTELHLNNANSSDTEIKKDSKDQDSIQTSTTPFPGYQMGKQQNHNKHHKQEPRGQPFPFS